MHMCTHLAVTRHSHDGVDVRERGRGAAQHLTLGQRSHVGHTHRAEVLAEGGQHFLGRDTETGRHGILLVHHMGEKSAE